MHDVRPSLIVGGRHADARGVVSFCNEFDMTPVRRFYSISNDAASPVRGWIGHRTECKWFVPTHGATVIRTEPMDGACVRAEFVLDAASPAVLRVPGGNWFAIEQDGEATVMVFSDCRVGEHPNDDFRRAYD